MEMSNKETPLLIEGVRFLEFIVVNQLKQRYSDSRWAMQIYGEISNLQQNNKYITEFFHLNPFGSRW